MFDSILKNHIKDLLIEGKEEIAIEIVQEDLNLGHEAAKLYVDRIKNQLAVSQRRRLFWKSIFGIFVHKLTTLFVYSAVILQL